MSGRKKSSVTAEHSLCTNTFEMDTRCVMRCAPVRYQPGNLSRAVRGELRGRLALQRPTCAVSLASPKKAWRPPPRGNARGVKVTSGATAVEQLARGRMTVLPPPPPPPQFTSTGGTSEDSSKRSWGMGGGGSGVGGGRGGRRSGWDGRGDGMAVDESGGGGGEGKYGVGGGDRIGINVKSNGVIGGDAGGGTMGVGGSGKAGEERNKNLTGVDGVESSASASDSVRGAGGGSSGVTLSRDRTQGGSTIESTSTSSSRPSSSRRETSPPSSSSDEKNPQKSSERAQSATTSFRVYSMQRWGPPLCENRSHTHTLSRTHLTRGAVH